MLQVGGVTSLPFSRRCLRLPPDVTHRSDLGLFLPCVCLIVVQRRNYPIISFYTRNSLFYGLSLLRIYDLQMYSCSTL